MLPTETAKKKERGTQEELGELNDRARRYTRSLALLGLRMRSRSRGMRFLRRLPLPAATHQRPTHAEQLTASSLLPRGVSLACCLSHSLSRAFFHGNRDSTADRIRLDDRTSRPDIIARSLVRLHPIRAGGFFATFPRASGKTGVYLETKEETER